MDKSIRILIFSFFSLFSLGALAVAIYQPNQIETVNDSYLNLFEPAEEISGEESTIPVSEELPEISELPKIKGRLEKDIYEDHLLAAEENGVGLIENEWELYQLLTDEVLVEVKKGSGYQVEDLTYSHPYVTQHSKKVLEEIGQMYEILAGEGNFFTVSSVTRTMGQQKNLKKRNRNATAGNSSHSYGVSFDISYIRFNGVRNFDQKAQKHLETVLNHFQKTNKIYVIKERKQSCYHITVR